MAMAKSQLLTTALDDAQGIVLGVASAAVGFVFLGSAGLMTGQTAGLAIILAKLTSLSFGLSFFLVNLPFYVVGWFFTGRSFVIKTFLCVSMLSVLVELLPYAIIFSHLDPLIAALAYGVSTGLGLLGLIRHGGSLGGIGIAALAMQSRFNIRAGYVQLACDVIIFAIGLLLFSPTIMFYSFVGALTVNVVIAWNHIAGRYHSGRSQTT